MSETDASTAALPHVVVLGAGFAGAGALSKLKDAPVRVTVVDRNPFHTFQPLLYQVATLQLEEHEVGFPAHEMLHGREGWSFVQAEVEAIDLDAKVVTGSGIDPISYDYLIVGLGAVVNFFNTPGAAEHAFPLYSMADASRLKAQILERFAAANADPSLVDDGALTFCVVGGGATGVETSGALSELIHREFAKDYPNLPIERAGVHLYEMGPELLAPFKPRLRNYAKRALEKRGVQVHLGEGVTEVEATRVHLKSGEIVNCHTLIWAAGLVANPLVHTLGVELVKGRVPVGPGLNLEQRPEVFVIGDNAIITAANAKQQLPQLGSVALQAGEHTADSITHLVHGRETSEFKYMDKGTMATIGFGAAIVQMPHGITLTGKPAWVSWLGIHLVLLSGGKERAETLMEWGNRAVEQSRWKL